MPTTSPAVVGRDVELALLQAALTELQSGGGRSVLLLGEAGIGKSRLIGCTAEQATALGLPVLRGRGSAIGAGTPFRPIVEALSSHFRIGGPPEDPELGPYRPVLARVVQEWRQTPAPDYPESLVELGEALLRLLAVLGRKAGCVLVLEDLHEADSETVAVVEYLVDNLAGLPVLLVASLRPEPGAALDLVRSIERRRMASVVTPQPLERRAVQAIAAGCLGVPADRVPPAVVERLTVASDGNPYLVEELLAEMVGSGALRPGTDGWQVAGDLSGSVPAAVVHVHHQRLAALDEPVRELLLLAATLGPRFSVATLQIITGHDDASLFAHLRAAVAGNFVLPDDAAPGEYAFRHALTAEAVLASIPAAERAAPARRAAAAIQQAEPELSADRCQLVAGLLLAAGDRTGAALLYADAGRQALADGASGSAVRLLERGQELGAAADRTDITASLACALAEAGQLDRAIGLADDLPLTGAASPAAEGRIELHTRLAWAAVIAERCPETVAQLAAARALLGDRGQPAQTAALDVIEGHLALLPSQDARAVDAERSAREAAEVAEREKRPVLACQAWQLLALLARERGFDDADGCLERMLTVAEANALPVWRLEALLRLGANAFMRTGDARRLEQARAAAQELGAITLHQRVESLLAMNAVLRGDPATAEEIIGRCLDASARMRNLDIHRYLLLTSAILAAHRGRRREMERVLLAFRQAGGEKSFLTPVMLGLCRAVCALLEEDRKTAAAELAAGAQWEAQHPNVFYLAGRYGLRPLLAVLAGTAGRAEYLVVAGAPAAELAWNRQFLLFADAVLLGREGRAEEAAQVVEQARRTGGLFPTGHHLGLRLVAEAALAEGWGDPVGWLRTAEEYFHALDVPSVASACRALLRQAGVSVAQHRSGSELIPEALRRYCLTPREYEVLALLVERPGNQDLARRLSISPRTVEKHMASLIQKTGQADRASLCRLAIEFSGAG
ncbi:DNA-binding CsgD family transcriptional regulator [Kitasatospora sp. MAA4]|uniref:helix-turn-helix transcriptional regulator n=1 Tax=Kitasatospora sp. MAA4 TaxID=3035093 RepID=UPI002472F210|nr:AAA family ATPase [Kitasatospora sp. MAA4]MDH6136915.1 DNA-binding CsgD family transcriptional regulator [Kitasatospora sp. MAA4]